MASLIDPALLLKVVLYVGVLNVVLSAVKQVLDKVAPSSQADSVVGKIVSVVQGIVDWLSANTPH